MVWVVVQQPSGSHVAVTYEAGWEMRGLQD
jgi:hypothetical protein